MWSRLIIVTALWCQLVALSSLARHDDFHVLWEPDRSKPPPPTPLHLTIPPAVIDGALEFHLELDSASGKPVLVITPSQELTKPFALTVRTEEGALHYTLRVPGPNERVRAPEFTPPSETFLIHVTYPESAGRDKTATFLAKKDGDTGWSLRALHETGFARLHATLPAPPIRRAER
jgi:hypothetical protein